MQKFHSLPSVSAVPGGATMRTSWAMAMDVASTNTTVNSEDAGSGLSRIWAPRQVLVNFVPRPTRTCEIANYPKVAAKAPASQFPEASDRM